MPRGSSRLPARPSLTRMLQSELYANIHNLGATITSTRAQIAQLTAQTAELRTHLETMRQHHFGADSAKQRLRVEYKLNLCRAQIEDDDDSTDEAYWQKLFDETYDTENAKPTDTAASVTRVREQYASMAPRFITRQTDAMPDCWAERFSASLQVVVNALDEYAQLLDLEEAGQRVDKKDKARLGSREAEGLSKALGELEELMEHLDGYVGYEEGRIADLADEVERTEAELTRYSVEFRQRLHDGTRRR